MLKTPFSLEFLIQRILPMIFMKNYSMNNPSFDILQTTNIFTNYD